MKCEIKCMKLNQIQSMYIINYYAYVQYKNRFYLLILEISSEVNKQLGQVIY